MDFAAGGRHELKFLISQGEYLMLKSRVSAVLTPDSHGGETGYFIRSIYLDDPWESAYHEKLAGVRRRRKYRIRAYNHDPGHIRLECKEKRNQRVYKYAASLDESACEALIRGDYSVLAGRREQACLDVYAAYHKTGLQNSATVDYRREAFVYPVSNLRLTFDHELRAGGFAGFSLFDRRAATLPVYANGGVILEIKYDDGLPEPLRLLLPPTLGVPLSISKYCLCKDLVKAVRI